MRSAALLNKRTRGACTGSVDTAASIMPSMLADPFGLSIIGVQRLGNQVWASTGKCHRALAQLGEHAIDHRS